MALVHARAKPAHCRTARSRQPLRINAIAGLFSFIGTKPAAQRIKLKEELLGLLPGLDRGASASEEEKAEVERLASALERANPTNKPLASPLLTGKWRLLYTTSASILASGRPPFLRPQGPIFQTIDAESLKARNNETFPFFNQVSADLTPLDSKTVAVQFKEFKLLGLITITAPPSARGQLAVTYLDEDLRISRGDKGNLFVLDMADREARL